MLSEPPNGDPPASAACANSAIKRFSFAKKRALVAPGGRGGNRRGPHPQRLLASSRLAKRLRDPSRNPAALHPEAGPPTCPGRALTRSPPRVALLLRPTCPKHRAQLPARSAAAPIAESPSPARIGS